MEFLDYLRRGRALSALPDAFFDLGYCAYP
jgi:hypothetical protein